MRERAGSNLPEAVANLTDRAFMIVVQDFQDPYTLNVKQLMKCCVEEITPDGRLIPFCAYNSVGYREQVRAADVRRAGRRRGAERDRAAAAAGRLAVRFEDRRKPGRAGNGHRPAIAPDTTNVGRRAVDGVTSTGPRSRRAARRPTAVTPWRCCSASPTTRRVWRLTRRLADRLRLRGGGRVADVAAGPGAPRERWSPTTTSPSTEWTSVSPLWSVRAMTVRPGGRGFGFMSVTRSGFRCRTGCSTRWCASARSAPFRTRPPRRPSSPGCCGPVVGWASPTSPSSAGGLPEELTTLAAWVACIADARPLSEYSAILDRAGLRTVHTERHDEAIARMIDEIDARLRLLRMTAPARLAAAGVDVPAVLRYTHWPGRRSPTGSSATHCWSPRNQPTGSPHQDRDHNAGVSGQ